MTYRALELLNLPTDEPLFLLDIGCGSGLSSMLGEYLRILLQASSNNRKLTLRGEVALEREVEGDLFLQDIGQGFGFRPSCLTHQSYVVYQSSNGFSMPKHLIQHPHPPTASPDSSRLSIHPCATPHAPFSNSTLRRMIKSSS